MKSTLLCLKILEKNYIQRAILLGSDQMNLNYELEYKKLIKKMNRSFNEPYFIYSSFKTYAKSSKIL
ncbi:hypothetical protein ALC152_07420 [Arcobacter sp. 15-2]